MDPATLATMYAINVGLGALGGKRGSNLFKDSFKDTATMALTQSMMPPGSSGGRGIETLNFLETTPDSPAVKSVLTEQSEDLLNKQNQSRLGQFLGKIEEPFLKPGTQDISKFRVGLGAAGLGAGAYGLGLFDPVPPKDPVYPGYNKFYAQNPGQFMPYDDPDFGIDYSNYPDKPYSGIKSGGIMSLQEGGMPAPDLLREEYEKYKQQKDSAGEEAMSFDQFKQFRMQFGPMQQGGIAKLMAGGRASNMPVESIEEGTQEEMDMIAPPMSSIMPRQMFMPMMMAKDGALVDKLPSKTNTDERDESNYKRTSGKLVVDAAGKGNEEKDTMLAQLADGEFVTKSKAVRGAGIALGANPKDKKQQRELGARFFYKQMADFDKLAKRLS